MSTAGDVIAYNLTLDAYNTVGDPQTIYLNNTTVFSSSGNVPVWMYTPLWSILGCASSDLSSRIIANYGEARLPAQPCVVLQPTELIESADISHGSKSTLPGARFCYFDIAVKNLITDKDITRVENALNRITYLIDYYCRENRTTNKDTIDLVIPSNYSGFYQSPFRCQLKATYLPVAKEGYSRYCCEFVYTFV